MGRSILLLFIFVSAGTVAYSQQRLTGKVTDSHSEPIELATIKLEGLNRIAMTNDSGYFSMSLPTTIKKGDAITIRAYKEGFKETIKHIEFSGMRVMIILDDGSPVPAVKQVAHVTQSDTSYFENKALAIRQSNITEPRVLDKENLRFLFYSLPADKTKPIKITCIKDDLEAFHFANAIHEVLLLSGYKNVGDVSLTDFLHPVKGQFLNNTPAVFTITIGHKI